VFPRLKGVFVVDDGSRWLTTYEAMQFVRSQGKRLSTASIRRACITGAIPLAERHAIGNNRDLWLIGRQPLIDWMAEGMPGRHHYQAKLILAGVQEIPERLRKKTKYGVCKRCGHSLEPKATDWQVKNGPGEIVIVRDTPAMVCPHCDEAIADADVLANIDRLITAGGGEVAQHRVIRYEPLQEQAGAEGSSMTL